MAKDKGRELAVPENGDEDNTEEIPKELEELFDRMGEGEDVGKFIAVARVVEAHYGPLPHPRIMRQYQEILPGAADRIITMAEKQQAHRMGLENSVISGDIKRADRGLLFGFVLFLVFAGGGIALLWTGKSTEGYALLLSSLIGGIANFVRVGRERKRELESTKGTSPAEKLKESLPEPKKKSKKKKSKK